MPRQIDDDQIDDDQLLESEEGASEGGMSEEEQARKAVPAWIISIAVHGVLGVLFALVVLVAEELVEETPPVKVTAIDPPPPRPMEKIERDIEETDLALDIDAPESDKVSPISELDVPVEEYSREEDIESEVPKGREEAVADSEMGGEGAFMAIGAGGGASGMFGSRSGGGKKRALGRFGGSKGSENAVDAALRWFKKHQGPDGQWNVTSYPTNCTENPKCEPGQHAHGGDANMACTGYAVLCFLGAGYDHRMPSKYKATVKKGIDWIVANQKGDGLLGERNYELGVAAMCLAEAYAMSNDPALKDPAQKAINVILARQTKEAAGGYGLAWDYVAPNPARNDSSVSGWCVMALKSAMGAGLSVGDGMTGAKNWLKKCWEAANPDFKTLTDPYKDLSWFPYCWNSLTGKCEGTRGTDAGHDLTPVGALVAVFTGHHQGDIMLETLLNHVMKFQFPGSYPCNTYYMYYNTLSVFQAGGDRWKKWNDTCRDMLVNSQRKSQDCFDGSWDFAGTKFPGYEVGRLLSTAYCCLSLEVYYRYVQVAGKDGAKAGAKKEAPKDAPAEK